MKPVLKIFVMLVIFILGYKIYQDQKDYNNFKYKID